MGSSRRSARGADPVVDAVAAALDAALDAGAAGSSLPEGACLAVAFSGGLDSTVLLHATASVPGAARVVAIHVHHGLQAAADAWPAH